MIKSLVEKVWDWAMNNVTVSACMGTLAVGLAIGGVCSLLEAALC